MREEREKKRGKLEEWKDAGERGKYGEWGNMQGKVGK